jgi:xanthine dehydrogenase accessory factor
MDNNYAKLVAELKENSSIVMMTKLPSKEDEKIEKTLLDSSKWDSSTLSEEMKIQIKKVTDRKLPELFKDKEGNQILLEPFFPESRMIVFGGGNISEHLVKLGSDVGFKVTVVDDRLTYANKERFPTASEVICESFERVFDKLKVHRNDYVVIVTRGHKYDKECLREVLNIRPEYLGMIGSKRRVKGIKEQLIEEGYDANLLDEMCSPIGFRIGGITPLEIAISIISQIIAQKRLGVSDMISCANAKRRVNYSDIDREVLENLAQVDEEKKAIVTVTSTKGSTPRGAGAKMIVWNDGKILGSIGGGCSEGEVILVARDLIEEEGNFTTMEVDMTGDVAEDQGMVCGGIMNVLIEVYPN